MSLTSSTRRASASARRAASYRAGRTPSAASDGSGSGDAAAYDSAVMMLVSIESMLCNLPVVLQFRLDDFLGDYPRCVASAAVVDDVGRGLAGDNDAPEYPVLLKPEQRDA